MKKLFLIIAFAVAAVTTQAQIDIAVKGDTLILPNGAKFWINEEVTVGNGTAPDKSFNFIYEPSIFGGAKHKPLSASYYNKKAVIRSFEKDANYRHSYGYNIIVLDFGDKHKYWCDVRGALDNNELMTSALSTDNKKSGTPAVF